MTHKDWYAIKQKKLSMAFFFSLYIDLIDAFLNFWPVQNVHFLFIQLTFNLL